MSPTAKPLRPLGLWVFVALSAALHGSFDWLVTTLFTVPDLDIEITLPMEVELGLADEVAVAEVAPDLPPEPAAPEDLVPPDDATDRDAERMDAGALPPEPEAGPDAAEAGTPSAEPAEGARDAGPEVAPPQDAAAPDGARRLPPGAQIAVRVDLTRVRNSPIADDARQFIAAVPDWQALLAGSGLSPVDQLDRLMIASPNLDRAKIVLAGRVLPEAHPRGAAALAAEAVTKLAAAQQVAAPWRTVEGVRVAPWANPDRTPRVIAMLDRLHFAICREEDLPRVLAIAAARAREQQQADAGPPTSAADALLSMEPGEGLSLEVEGVEQFVRKPNNGIPRRLRLSAVQPPDGPPRVSIHAKLTFEDADRAAAGLAFWEGIRNRYGRNAFVAMLGLAGPLRDATLEVEGDEVRAAVTLDVQQTRMVMGYVRELLSPPPPI